MQYNLSQITQTRIQIALSDYPILQDRIIEEMLKQLIRDQIFTLAEIDAKVREKALLSQAREGLSNPFVQEGPTDWENRLSRVRSSLIIQEYANRYPVETFNETVDKIVENRAVDREPDFFWHNIENTSDDAIFEQALSLERIAAGNDPDVLAALNGAKTTLIRRCLGQHNDFITIAKRNMKIQDLIDVHRKKIGKGSIGGKAAGFILARTILQHSADEEIRSAATTKDSYFIGADEFQTFLASNNLLDIHDVRYLPDQLRWDRFPEIRRKIKAGKVSKNIVEALEKIIDEIDGQPFIVRSSSLLEDSFYSSISGFYESIIIPNQSSKSDGLERILDAVRELYAQVFSPQALQYREKKGLLDYPERMAIIIQVIRGNRIGNYFYPDVSGYASSRSISCWHPGTEKVELNCGFARIVSGFGIHAVQRDSVDFPVLIKLKETKSDESDPIQFFPEMYQQHVAVINLKTNRVELIDVDEIPTEKYRFAPWAIQTLTDGIIQSLDRGREYDRSIINFNDLIKKSNFINLMRDIMSNLEQGFGHPVSIEFSVIATFHNSSMSTFRIQIDKCGPIDPSHNFSPNPIKKCCNMENRFIETSYNVYNKLTENIHYVVVIEPNQNTNRDGLQYWIRTLNREMAGERCIHLSTRRFGVSDYGSGIRLKSADILNSHALIEISDPDKNRMNDLPCGTQFYSNLIEFDIPLIPVILGHGNAFVDWEFLTSQPNVIDRFIKLPTEYQGLIRVLPVMGYKNAESLTLHSSSGTGKTCIHFETKK